MTTKMTSGCNGLPSFRHFCHLSCFAVRDVRDHCPFPDICTALCADACWLKGNQAVCTHEMSMVCVVTKRRAHGDYPCNQHLPDFFVSDEPEKRKNHYSFADSCLVSTVFLSRTVYAERTVSTATWRCFLPPVDAPGPFLVMVAQVSFDVFLFLLFSPVSGFREGRLKVIFEVLIQFQ